MTKTRTPDLTTATRYDIPLAVPDLSGNEDRYVLDALARNELAVGSYIPHFERTMARYAGVRHAVAVSSGTAALHLALLAAGVGPGDEVIVPSLTFAATAFAVSYCGAHPVFVDVEPEYWQMDAGPVDEYLRLHGESGVVKAILPVALLGHLWHPWLREIARCWDLPIVEDAAESLGAECCSHQVGALMSMSCLSFNATKTITAAGGGMVLTDHVDLAARVRHLANQARVPGNAWSEIEHDTIGYNYRMSNLQAAIGCAQMERIDEFLAKKRAIAERYQRELADVPGITMQGEAPWARSSWWLSTVRVDAEQYGMDSRALLAKLAEAGIQCRPLFKPLHLQAAYAGREHMPCPVAERLWMTALSLPSSVGLTEADQGRVCDVICQGA